MAQKVGAVKFTIVLLRFLIIVALETDTCGASVASLVNFSLRDIVTGVFAGRTSSRTTVSTWRSVGRL
jgi:hypothetical protein